MTPIFQAAWPLPFEAHLWRIDTPLPDADTALPALHDWLSPDEQARASRMRMPGQRERFIARRGLMRQVLAGYLNARPEDVAFAYGPQGKPMLRQMAEGAADAPSGHAPSGRLSFNLTHSQDTAILVVVADADVGVDVEAFNLKRNIPGIARRFFHEDEWRQLRNQPAQEQAAMFFQLWACKEALVKAHGGGIFTGMNKQAIHLPALPISPDAPPIGPVQAVGQSWVFHVMTLTDHASQTPLAGAVALPAHHGDGQDQGDDGKAVPRWRVIPPRLVRWHPVPR